MVLALVSRFGPAVRLWAGKQKGLGSIPLRLSFLFKKVVVCGHCLVTLSITINETLKWLSSLPILMPESLWRTVLTGIVRQLPFKISVLDSYLSAPQR